MEQMMEILKMVEPDIMINYKNHKQPNVYMFFHIGVELTKENMEMGTVCFETMGVLRAKLSKTYDSNSTETLVTQFIEEGYDQDPKGVYVLYCVTNNGYIQYCTWMKLNNDIMIDVNIISSNYFNLKI